MAAGPTIQGNTPDSAEICGVALHRRNASVVSTAIVTLFAVALSGCSKKDEPAAASHPTAQTSAPAPSVPPTIGNNEPPAPPRATPPIVTDPIPPTPKLTVALMWGDQE